MRPLGHTEARDGRSLRAGAADAALRQAWETYCSFAPPYRRSFHEHSFDRYCYAKQLLSPLKPSLLALHRFALEERATIESSVDSSIAVGLFVSAGYQVLPTREIVYDLELPQLDSLGAFLEHKRLVIRGSTGSNTGDSMLGVLVNEGEVGPFAGMWMIGRFDNRGTHGRDLALEMFGHYSCGTSHPDCEMFDFFIGRWNDSWNIRDPTPERKKRFLVDIAHPRGWMYEARHDWLKRRYA